MRPTVVTFFLLFFPCFLTAQNDTIVGDLTGDGIPEMAILYNLQVNISDGGYEEDTLAQLIVYRQQNDAWKAWPAATGPMMYAYSEYGFDRFYVAIERGALVLEHYSGGYTKISFTHRFRWQNDQFELIGATSSVYERCDWGRRLDYNLSTGDYEYEEYTTDCDSTDDIVDVTTKSVKAKAPKTGPLLLTDFKAWEHSLKVKGGENMSY